jgi:beta-lactamase regulating signal transducer with metallopeptidase domain
VLELGGLPGVSLAGIWRPRIVIGPDARMALTPEELDLAISHEVAHRRSRDNLKRFLMYAAPDMFGWTRVAQQLEDRWQAEAECEADADAVRGDGDRAAVLASALVKVARLATGTGLHPVSPVWTSSAFHVPTLLELRVRRLLDGTLPPVAARRLGWSSVMLSMSVAAVLWLAGFSDTLHTFTEALVTRLP